MQQTPQSNYALMRAAMQLFDKPRVELDEHEFAAALQQANRELAIGKRILESDGAVSIVVPEEVVEGSFRQLLERFDSEAEFDRALEQNHLDRQGLLQALHYELKVEGATEQLLAAVSEVDEHELEIYYYQHLERFEMPETRTARHILITINDDYPENRPQAAAERMERILSEVDGEGSFATLAEKQSECPTAMHGGLLGRVRPGQLYPELDATLFAMEEGECSAVVRTEVGLHILYCETVHPAQRLGFDGVREKLREHLSAKKRQRALKQWLQQTPVA
ncbi:MAG: nitrogen fixation protein NifM [Pseudomonadota bacterium]